MASNEIPLCYVCFLSGTQDMLECGQCYVSVHRKCADLFNLEKGGTYKKIKLGKSVYTRIRKYPQLENAHFNDWFNVWVCDRCMEGGTDQTSCEFCQLRDGLLVKVKFTQVDRKKGKRKLPDLEPKWAHLNCILKLYGYKPKKDLQDKAYILPENELADAPDCKKCGAPYKMDIKCQSCLKHYAHNLCLQDDKPILKLCPGCGKQDDIQEKLDSNSSGLYMQRAIQSLVDSGKYDDFCVNKDDKPEVMPQKTTGRRRKPEENKWANNSEKDGKINEHFLKFTEKNELIYAFPFARKDLFFQSLAADKLTSDNAGLTLNSSYGSTMFGAQVPNLDKMDVIEEKNKPDLMDVGLFSFKNDVILGEEGVKKEEAMEIANLEDIEIKAEVDLQTKVEEVETVPKKSKKLIFNIIKESDLRKKEKEKDKEKEREKQKEKDKKKKKEIKVKGLDILAEKVENWQYISSVQIVKALQKIYQSQIADKDESEKIRITKKWYELLEELKDSNHLKTYDEKMTKEIKDKFSLYERYRVQCENWPMIPHHYRRYEWIEDYVPSTPISESANFEIKKTISSRKTHQCPANCTCSDLSTLGPYIAEKQTWDTQCPGRCILMECDETCGCDLSVCKNQSISTNLRKKLNQDLKETFCWGIDYSTHNNILLVLPEYKDVDKNDFIEKKLLRAVHLTDTPWDMISVCKKIVLESKKGNKLYSRMDKKLAKMLIRAIKFVNTFDNKAFRLHTKGYGVVCMKETGISANDLIAEYFGEIYTPWRWFEKQDLIKKYCKEKNKKDELPDFYNILLEKHKDDPDGYDILMIDPINKGNYSSRFSHSCDPNCGTVTTVANKKYGVAMYSLKNISFGEELTFDYFSVTENEKEYKQAICLCGSRLCRIHYLNLFTSKNQNSYLEKNLTFVLGAYMVGFGCLDPLTEEDHKLFEQYAFHGSILNGCPPWLVKWIALVLKFIQSEKEEYVNFVFPKKKAELEGPNKKKILSREVLNNLKTQLNLEKLSLETDRIQMLTITVNKVKHVLSLIKEKYEEGTGKPRIKPTCKNVEKQSSQKSVSRPINKPAIAAEIAADVQERNDNLPRAMVAEIQKSSEEQRFPPPEFFQNDFMKREKIRAIKKETEKTDKLDKLDIMSTKNDLMIPEKSQDSPKDQDSIGFSGSPSVGEFLAAVRQDNSNDFNEGSDDMNNVMETDRFNEAISVPILQNKENSQPIEIASQKIKEAFKEDSNSVVDQKSIKEPQTINIDEILGAPLKKVDTSKVSVYLENKSNNTKVCEALWNLNEPEQEQEQENLHAYFQVAKSGSKKNEKIINEVLKIVKRFNVKTEFDPIIKEIVQKSQNIITSLDDDDEAKFYVIRRLCFEFSTIFRKLPKSINVDWIGISDILYFYSQTFTYFVSNPYPQVSSDSATTVRRCDIPDFARYFDKQKEDLSYIIFNLNGFVETTAQEEAEELDSEFKSYGASYIWAQLTNWYKQTIERPEATLSNEKRGTVCYPSLLDSFIDIYAEPTKEFTYPHKTRETWLKKMLENPTAPWSTGKVKNSWHFKNERKMYGSFIFDAQIFKDKYPDFAQKIIKAIDKDDKERRKSFDEVNSYYFERIKYQLPPQVQSILTVDFNL